MAPRRKPRGGARRDFGHPPKRLNVSKKELLALLPALWAETGNTANLRFAYMDTVSALYKKKFFMMPGDWCRAPGDIPGPVKPLK